MDKKVFIDFDDRKGVGDLLFVNMNHLYDLTYDEVLIVDPESPITREKYENNHE